MSKFRIIIKIDDDERFKSTLMRKSSKLWPESFITKVKECTEGLQVYKLHRLLKSFRIKVSSRNCASEIYSKFIYSVFFRFGTENS